MSKKNKKEEKSEKDNKKVEKNNNGEKKKSSKLKKIIIIVIILLLVVCGIFYYLVERQKTVIKNNIEKIKNQNQTAFIDYKNNIEFLTTWSYDELKNNLINEKNIKKGTNIEINVDSKKIDEKNEVNFEKVGKVNIDIYLTNNYKYKIIKEHVEKIKNHKKITLKVQDTISPVLNGVSNKTITVGDNFNILDGITATDEKEGNIAVQTEGEVDTSKVGTYKVKIFAVDKNGNKAEQEMEVVVKAKSTVSYKGSYSSSTNSSSSSSSSQSDASTVSGRLAIARLEARKVASQIFKPGMSNLQKAQAIASYLSSNVGRQLNQSNEAYKTNFGNEAYAAFVLKIAACSGTCKAAMLLCEQGGLQCKHINANQWTHQWLEVYTENGWLQLDPQLGAVGSIY